MLTIVSLVHRLFYKLTAHGKSPSITPDPNTIQNESKLIDFVMRIELTSNFIATTLRFSEQFDNTFSYIFVFGKMYHESHGVVVMPVTSCIKETCSNLALSN